MLDNLIGMGTGPKSGGDGIVKDSNTAGFLADVIEASKTVPVIVDFWAPWCGPCKQLGPQLEKLVRSENGKVRMVKINVDENQELAGQMRVQSIPAVFAFSGGQPVDGFMGALPESQLKQFIARLLSQGGAGATDELAAMLQAAAQAVTDGDIGMAGDLYAAILQADRENVEAIAGLAMVRFTLGDLAGAEATLTLVPPAKANDPVILQARAAIELASKPAVDTSGLAVLEQAVAANPGDHQTRFDYALALNQADMREQAMEELITIIRRERGWNEEAARKQL
ncbi:MAG: thioredoxin, partial [Aestuariivirgaceae bacterium]|nr:thioredoxin [Aestuariivirgaceae bacterium]